MSAPKILALYFKYLGDAVLMTPALRALREHFPQSEIHVLVPSEVAPLLQHIPWLTKVWAMPRRRGSARPFEAWPIIRALRREKFDRSVDFGGNDRGAFLSFLIGAKRRLTRDNTGGFAGRKFCYTERMAVDPNQHETRRMLRVLSAWGVPEPSGMEMEIHVDPAVEKAATVPFPPGTVFCHVSTSSDKKQWPVANWAELYRLCRAAEINLVFTTGNSPREQAFLAEIKKAAPEITILSATPDLATYLVWIKHAAMFVSGDTGPLHFAAALGVRTIGIFGSSVAAQWAPIGEKNIALQGAACTCDVHAQVCSSATPCIAKTTAEMVVGHIRRLMGSAG